MAEQVPGKDETRLDGTAAVEKVRSLLAHFRSTMMVTPSGDGSVHVRPMGLQGEPQAFDGVLWFFTDERSRKVREVEGTHRASLVFQSDDDSAYLHLQGRATEVHDRAKMAELYTPMLKTWFPDGLDDPHITLLRFDADEGHYWDSPGGMLQVLGAFVKSVATGSPGQGGESGRVEL